MKLITGENSAGATARECTSSEHIIIAEIKTKTSQR
jgi:hypothetical protein